MTNKRYVFQFVVISQSNYIMGKITLIINSANLISTIHYEPTVICLNLTYNPYKTRWNKSIAKLGFYKRKMNSNDYCTIFSNLFQFRNVLSNGLHLLKVGKSSGT